MTTSLPLAAKTLYAELREQALIEAASPDRAPDLGGVVFKHVYGDVYGYYQFRDLAGKQRQTYLGPLSDPDVKGIIDRFENRSQSSTDALAKALRGLIGSTVDAKTFKVLRAFSESGILTGKLGGAVLVGTHAFNALAPVLGVSWSSMTVTQDIDVAADKRITIAVRPEQGATPQSVLDTLKMGFAPVPTMNPKSPSTSFSSKSGEMRVDLLTTSSGKPGGPVFIPTLNSYAEPLVFMDYLLDGVIQVPLVGPRKAILVTVPAPERFALHKLLVSESRPTTMMVKAEKDRRQAMQVLEVLLEEAPDSIETAMTDLVGRGKGWRKRIKSALSKCHKLDEAVASEIQLVFDDLAD